MVTGWPLIMTVAVSLSRLSPPIRSKVKTAWPRHPARRASFGQAARGDHQQLAQRAAGIGRDAAGPVADRAAGEVVGPRSWATKVVNSV
jgi:hypothetical protein